MINPTLIILRSIQVFFEKEIFRTSELDRSTSTVIWCERSGVVAGGGMAP